MRTPASIARHPIHPMLVALPIGLWVFSLFCDLVARAAGGDSTWNTMALYTIVVGIAGAIVAGLAGFIDLIAIPPGPVRRTALKHMGINVTIIVLYVLNATIRRADEGSSGAMWLSALAVLLLVVSGWLGGKLVYSHGVAVDTESVLRNEPRNSPPG